MKRDEKGLRSRAPSMIICRECVYLADKFLLPADRRRNRLYLGKKKMVHMPDAYISSNKGLTFAEAYYAGTT